MLLRLQLQQLLSSMPALATPRLQQLRQHQLLLLQLLQVL
jgi:hypothetical protein